MVKEIKPIWRMRIGDEIPAYLGGDVLFFDGYVDYANIGWNWVFDPNDSNSIAAYQTPRYKDAKYKLV